MFCEFASWEYKGEILVIVGIKLASEFVNWEFKDKVLAAVSVGLAVFCEFVG